MWLAFVIVVGYLAGSLPFGFWAVRIFRGVDIRTVGSGNIGASNVWRTYGKKFGIPVVLLDTLKGFVPALAATLVEGHLAGALAGGAAMLGHWRPVFLRFQRGGKMVATCGGAFLGLAPFVGLIAGGVWIVVFVLCRYSSVASMLAALSLPAIAFAFGEPWPVIVFGALAGVAVVVLHRANLARLRSGTENRAKLRRRRGAPAIG